MSELLTTPQAAAANSIPAEAPWTWKETIPDDAELRKLGGDVVADEPCHLGHAESLLWKKCLGERIAALQQLVSPFGKTDTACILYEALGYIRFLHGQVQVLSSAPYVQRLPPSAPHVPLPAVVEEPSDLRSRGLCLVPLCCSDRVTGVDVCSLAAAMGLAAEEEDTEAPPWMLRLRGDHHPGQPV